MTCVKSVALYTSIVVNLNSLQRLSATLNDVKLYIVNIGTYTCFVLLQHSDILCVFVPRKVLQERGLSDSRYFTLWHFTE